MAKWYKFWKKVQGHVSEEYFVHEDLFGDDASYQPDEKSLKAQCEYWAERMPGGHNTHYSYGFQEVSNPPVKKLEEMIKTEKRVIKGSQERLELLAETLKKIKAGTKK